MAQHSVGERLGRALARFKDAPPLLTLRKKRHARWFASTRQYCFSGVYESFAAAVAGAPPGRPIGSDHEHAADIAIPGGPETLERVNARDYPLLYWLREVIQAGARRVFDFGGHVGVKYYAFRPYLRYPPDLRWTVYDMPAVTAAGRRLATQRADASQLSFTDRLLDADGVEVFFATGSLQYEETLPWTILGRFAKRPEHLVLGGLPLSEVPRYVTLLNIGGGYCPYYVFNREEMIEGIASLGYRLVDRWPIPDKRCLIPFDEGRSVNGYTGLYFRRVAPPGA
jgi:putative methyltransferase (TIGR04325 family)